MIILVYGSDTDKVRAVSKSRRVKEVKEVKGDSHAPLKTAYFVVRRLRELAKRSRVRWYKLWTATSFCCGSTPRRDGVFNRAGQSPFSPKVFQ